MPIVISEILFLAFWQIYSSNWLLKSTHAYLPVQPNRSANLKAAPSIYCLFKEDRQKL